MTERAKITSVEAVESFRAHLIVFLSKARPALEEVNDDVRRMRVWLQSEQRAHWENEVRRRTKELEQAQQELFSARLSGLREATSAQQFAVNRARRALQEAEARLRVVKKWNRDFDNLTQPMIKQLEQIHSIMASDMPRAVAYLAQVVSTLESYANIPVPAAAGAASWPGGAQGSDSTAEVEEAHGPAPALPEDQAVRKGGPA
jgi:DNA repair exonuclease SbcCD ATPase subunit